MTRSDHGWMMRALVLARKALGQTHPNPMVGAIVLDKNGAPVGQGFHVRAGEAHAEVVALTKAGVRAQGGTLVVTLEPCTIQGRTPPCSKAVIASGVRRVVIAALDPNPKVFGEGVRALQEAGLEVVVGVCEKAARRLNRVFEKNITQGQIFVQAKLAMSQNRIVGQRGPRMLISDPMMERTTMKLRACADALLVGIGTVLADNPRLTVRDRRWQGRTPIRLILDPMLQTPPRAALFDDPTPVWLVHAPEAKILKSFNKDTHLLEAPRDASGEMNVEWILQELWRRGVHGLLIEGGPKTLSWFRGRVDEWVFYVHEGVLSVSEPVWADLGGPLHLSIQSAIRRAHDWEIVAKPCLPGSLKPLPASTA